MEFDMGQSTLTDLTKKTSTSTDDLGSLVRQLAQAGEPLEGKFNGAGRAAFDAFKNNVDGIANELNASLAAVLAGIQGQDVAWQQGEQEMADQTKSADSGAAWDSARFSARA